MDKEGVPILDKLALYNQWIKAKPPTVWGYQYNQLSPIRALPG